ncbi:zinc ribbon domain-containing protein [Haloarchaeobius sp. DFWS5]|uniref:zinc ribbon domain-containing protein n=1 Tax=Haloarchaeobius sp. DFWS5 TaxID=3446114 RepID=UPI003EB846CB
MSRGVATVGLYAPRYRVPAAAFADAWGNFKGSGIEQVAVPGPDEDTLTMGYEAAVGALAESQCAASEVDWVGFATTNPPLEESDVLARFGAMLGLRSDAVRRRFCGHTGTGVQALRAGFEADGTALVVASDAPRGEPDSGVEHAAGAGAAAFLVDEDGAGRLVDAAECSEPYPGTRFRERGTETTTGLGMTAYDRQSFEQTVAGAVDRLAYDPDDLDAVAMQAPDGRLPYRVASVVGVEKSVIHDHALVHELGDVGAASAPLSLAKALAAGEEQTLAVGYGSGATATALLVETTDSVPASVSLDGGTELDYAAYLRRRGSITGDEPDGGGAYISVPTWRRSLPQRYRLEAGQCPDCGTLNFPPTGACTDCHGLVEYESVTLSKTGTLEAVSVVSQGGAPPEFAALQAASGAYATGIVAFDGPDESSASAPALVVDADPDSVAVGDRVEATIRRIYTQEGVTRYGVAVRPH